jgi:hypothetical protein
MAIEVLVDGNGTILALNATHERQASTWRSTRELRRETSGGRWPPAIGMQPRADHQLHLVTLPPELERMPLKEIHLLFRLVHDVGGPRLERITS